MKRKDFAPLIMWLVLFAGIITVAFFRPGRMAGLWNGYRFNVDTLFIALYVLWMLIELRVSHRDAETEGKTISDLASCPLYGFGQALTILTALWLPSVWSSPNAAHVAGFGICLLGVCYRLWAIHTLGRFYSHLVQTMDHHRIVVSGPYRFTRHPAYAGMIIANAGISLYFLNWATLGAFLFILVPAIILRILIEERVLFAIEGYTDFAKPRKRLFPAIW